MIFVSGHKLFFTQSAKVIACSFLNIAGLVIVNPALVLYWQLLRGGTYHYFYIHFHFDIAFYSYLFL